MSAQGMIVASLNDFFILSIIVSLFKQFQFYNHLLSMLRSFCSASSLLHTITLQYCTAKTEYFEISFLVSIMSSKGKRLSESHGLEVIAKFSVPSGASERSLAREYRYDVSEGAIRKIIKNQESVQKRSPLMSEEGKTKVFRASIGRFSELEDILYV